MNKKMVFSVIPALIIAVVLICCKSEDDKLATAVTLQGTTYTSGCSCMRISVKIGVPAKTDTLRPFIMPVDAANKNVTYSNKHPELMTVENGAIKAVAAGTDTLTVHTTDGSNLSAWYQVIIAQ